jgi:hypothetical protein
MVWAKRSMMFLLLGSAVGCGYPPPQEIRPGVYQLQFCEREEDCFEAAKKTCPNGFRITKYGGIRPEEFVCAS